jgi:hypothetical protein
MSSSPGQGSQRLCRHDAHAGPTPRRRFASGNSALIRNTISLSRCTPPRLERHRPRRAIAQGPSSAGRWLPPRCQAAPTQGRGRSNGGCPGVGRCRFPPGGRARRDHAPLRIAAGKDEPRTLKGRSLSAPLAAASLSHSFSSLLGPRGGVAGSLTRLRGEGGRYPVEAPGVMNLEVRRIRPDEGLNLRAIRLRALRDAPMAFGSTLAREEAFPESVWHDRAAGGASGTESATFVAQEGAQWIGLGHWPCQQSRQRRSRADAGRDVR